jgi:hypothetical protein
MKAQKYSKTVFADERGIAMIVAMLVLLVLTIIGVASTKTAIYDTVTAHADKKKRTAFYTAEAGLEHGKSVASAYVLMPLASDPNPTPKWNNKVLFAGTYVKGSGYILRDTSKELKNIPIGTDKRYTYTVFVRNNSDGSTKDPSDNILSSDFDRSKDLDGDVIMRSESSSTIDGGGRAIIEAVIGNQPPLDSGSIRDKTGQFGHGTGKTNSDEASAAISDFTEQTKGVTIGTP